MRVVMKVKIKDIAYRKKHTFNPKVWVYAYQLWRGAKLPFVTLLRVMGGYIIVDGRCRVAAHALLGRKEITASVGIPEDPNPYSDLRHKPGPFTVPQPQADGYSLPEPTSYKD